MSISAFVEVAFILVYNEIVVFKSEGVKDGLQEMW